MGNPLSAWEGTARKSASFFVRPYNGDRKFSVVRNPQEISKKSGKKHDKDGRKGYYKLFM